MGMPVVTVASGGMPVVEATLGTPVTEAANKFGVPVTKVVGKPGLPVVFETIGVVAPVTYSTWSTTDKAGAVVISGGNLTATFANFSGVRGANTLASGKFYWEAKVNNSWVDSRTNVGFATATATMSNGASNSGIVVMQPRAGSNNIFLNGASVGMFTGTCAVGNSVGIAIDTAAKLVWFRLVPSGNWNGSGAANPATGVGGVDVSSMANFYPYTSTVSGSGDSIVTNFGASAFVGAVPAGFTAGWPA